MAKRSTYAERLGKRLLALRKAACLSQKEVCLALGLEPYEMSRFEHGDAQLPFQVALALAKWFGLNVSVLDPDIPLAEEHLLMLMRKAFGSTEGGALATP